MSSAKDRNETVKSYITELLDKAESGDEEEFQNLPSYDELSETLDVLIRDNAKGFRGVVATAIAGRFVDKHYDFLNDFYACRPRSLFENAIYYAFDGRIPCGKSDPLNVAKNTSVLDENWAANRGPACMAAVNFLRALANNPKDYEILVDFFFFRLMEYANSIKQVAIAIPETEQESKLQLARKLATFVLDYPESGTIPQIVVSKLMAALLNTELVNVDGGEESVFGTNTTSKKPADIWVRSEDTLTNLYEITVKKIDDKRIRDALQNIAFQNHLSVPLTFICRIPEDVKELSLDELSGDSGTLVYNNKRIDFIDIKSFIVSVCSMLPDDKIQNIFSDLRVFMTAIDRPLKTKNGWNRLFL